MKKIRISPYLVIILCFLAPVLLGAALLCCPISTNGGGLDFTDGLFVATSAVCVTGLSTVEVGTTFTLFGQAVIAVLIEIGGLSILTIACFILSFIQKRMNYNEQTLMKEALNRDTMHDLRNLVVRIVIFSLCVQAAGAVINFVIFMCHYKDFFSSLRYAFFHAVSAYNNAGFDIFGTGDSLITLTQTMPPALNVLLKLNTMLLILIGGFGYVFIEDIAQKRNWRRLNVATKMVVIMSLALVLGGGVFIKLSALAGGQDVPLLECFFLSVSSRTAGFDNLGLGGMPGATLALVVFLMYIGAAPCSTGGGVKMTTLFVVFAVIAAFVKNKTPSFGYKKISEQSVLKAFVLIIFSILYIFLAIFLLSLTESASTAALIFEAVSAFSTTGLSLGITSSLSTAGKLILCVTMFLGRVGLLTFLSLMNRSWIFAQKQEAIRYVEENIIVG